MSKINIAAIAQNVGWTFDVNQPYTTFIRTQAKYPLVLHLGTQRIPVRHVAQHTTGSADEKLCFVVQDMLGSSHLEQALVLEGNGFRAPIVDWVKEQLASAPTRKLVVVPANSCEAWLRTRLGAAVEIPARSGVRDIAEQLRVRLSHRFTKARRGQVSGIKGATADFKQSRVVGGLGTSALLDLLHYSQIMNIVSVECSPAWHPQGVDLLCHFQENGDQVQVEVKTEMKTTGNVTIETISNMTSQALGWIYTSAAQVICYHYPETDDMFFFDMVQLREWFLMNQPSLNRKVTKGTTTRDGTRYTTEFYIAPIHRLFQDIPESLHVNLTEWLGPSVHRKGTKSLMPLDFQSRTASPCFTPELAHPAKTPRST